MVKRYYCDYCDKTFPYNTLNRKKHNDGIQHQTLRNNYYNNFRSLRTILEDEIQKKPCFKHLATSNCLFQNQCRCSHKTLNDLEELIKNYQLEISKKSKNVQQSDTKKRQKKEAIKDSDILIKNDDKKLTDYLSEDDKKLCNRLIPKFKLPEQLRQLSYLPPSLIPPTLDDFLNSTPNTWG